MNTTEVFLDLSPLQIAWHFLLPKLRERPRRPYVAIRIIGPVDVDVPAHCWHLQKGVAAGGEHGLLSHAVAHPGWKHWGHGHNVHLISHRYGLTLNRRHSLEQVKVNLDPKEPQNSNLTILPFNTILYWSYTGPIPWDIKQNTTQPAGDPEELLHQVAKDFFHSPVVAI